ncbi:MAG: hypothetical protein JWO36_4534 [Myxococcales bacterium]|nr:hypothetical protein [Myxococcales bacterium]
MLRRISLFALLAGPGALVACTPDLPHTAPTTFVTAVFDPTTSKIPLPNDLVFLNPVNSVCPPPANMLPATAPPACAQAELLASFAGKFPSDQEVAITIDFTETKFDDHGQTSQSAPDLDLSSFTPSTFFVYGGATATQGPVELAPLTASDYVKAADHGTLTIHHKDKQPWASGSYSVVLRGGPDGVKTTDGLPVYASQIFDLIAQGLDMTDPKNIGLLKAQTGSTAAALAQGAQLNQVINLYKQTAFPIADARFPHQELAIAATFQIQPEVTNVTIDPARSLVPLPIDLLRDATTGKLTALAACTLAGSHLDSNGTCTSPAAAGFQALDGFSTTGAILAPASDLVEASTVTPTTLQLYDLTDPAHPVLVNPANLILEPCEFTSGCGVPNPLSPVIAIQPAGASRGDPTSVFRTKPLKDATDYAVVMTTGIHDKAGNSIGPGTVAKVVRFKNPITVGGHSALVGIDDATAAQVEKMRLELQPVFATLAMNGTPAANVAMAYTFHTQTILSQAIKLAALPYTLPASTASIVAASLVTRTPSAAFTRFGVDTARVPSTNINEIIELDIQTLNALDPITGAFLPDPTQGALETIHVLIATPKVANTQVPACTGALALFGKCAPLMVFRHGLGGGRADMLTVADTFTAAGMTVVAIDAAKHGDRSFCTSGSMNQCNTGATCTTTLPSGAQGDTNPPGTCGTAGFVKRPVSPTCSGACAGAATDGIPLVSSNYLVTTNFFRTRDTLRQDLIDQAQLVRAIAFVPSGAPPTGHLLFDHMVAQGVIIDPATIYFSGQSLGAIQGTADVATNPRISKAALNVGGGTIVDIFTSSPAFQATTNALLAGLGVVPGTSEYLQFLVVAKTVLDPADPINFAGHLTANTLPNLLPPLGGNTNGSVPQLPKKILTQAANCDQVVPNPWNLLLASNVPTGPLPTGAAFFAPAGTGSFQLFVTPGFTFGSCSAGTVQHTFLTDWITPSLTTNAQTDVANFVMSDTLPLRVQHP